MYVFMFDWIFGFEEWRSIVVSLNCRGMVTFSTCIACKHKRFLSRAAWLAIALFDSGLSSVSMLNMFVKLVKWLNLNETKLPSLQCCISKSGMQKCQQLSVRDKRHNHMDNHTHTHTHSHLLGSPSQPTGNHQACFENTQTKREKNEIKLGRKESRLCFCFAFFASFFGRAFSPSHGLWVGILWLPR